MSSNNTSRHYRFASVGSEKRPCAPIRHLRSERPSKAFSAWEAAEYLEVSVPTLRRYVQSGKLVPSHVVGRNQMFSTQTLRAFKRTRG